MSLQRKTKVDISPIFYIVIVIIWINLIITFPILIVFIVIFFLNGKINLEKILQNTSVNNFLKKQFWTNYEKIIAEIKKSKKYKTRVHQNRQKRNQVEDLFTDNQWKQIDWEDISLKPEEKFKKMQRELENKQNQEKVFYQQNQKILQERFAESSKQKKSENKTRDSFKSSRSSQSNKNFFWTSHKSNLFSENKSIWDDYESVTDKFSSNKK